MKKCFLTQNGPKAIGPYSTATIHGDTCYLSVSYTHLDVYKRQLQLWQPHKVER